MNRPLPRDWALAEIKGRDGPRCDGCDARCRVSLEFKTLPGQSRLTIILPHGWLAVAPDPSDPGGAFERLFCPMCVAKHERGEPIHVDIP